MDVFGVPYRGIASGAAAYAKVETVSGGPIELGQDIARRAIHRLRNIDPGCEGEFLGSKPKLAIVIHADKAVYSVEGRGAAGLAVPSLDELDVVSFAVMFFD